MLVVVLDNLLRVIHATVTDLDGVAVEDYVCMYVCMYVCR